MKFPQKPNLFVFLALLAFFSVLQTSQQASEENTGGTTAKKWLLLLYDDADFFNGYDPLLDFAREAYAHENLDVLVLEDSADSAALIWQIGSAHQLIPLKMLDEINMADGGTLEYFLRYARKKFPDRSVILCFYDHGGGTWGACVDDTNDPTDILSLDEIQQALMKTGKVDLVCFTAPCLMGAIEAVYELRHLTDAYVGSENLSGYIYWFETIRYLCNILQTMPEISTETLADLLVKATRDYGYQNISPRGATGYTMSAIRTSALAPAVAAIRNLSTNMLQNPGTAFQVLDQALATGWRYSLESPRYLDAIDVFNRAAGLSSDAEMRGLFQRAAAAIQETVIRSENGSAMTGINGLNIYLPIPGQCRLSPAYGSTGIDFSLDSSWASLLKAYHNWRPSPQSHDSLLPIAEGNGLFPPPEMGKSRWIKWETDQEKSTQGKIPREK